jgi:hypothetical protein
VLFIIKFSRFDDRGGIGEEAEGQGAGGDGKDKGGKGELLNNFLSCLFPMTHAQCPMPNAQCPMFNDCFVFLILFNCDGKNFKAFANLCYLS